MSRRRRKAPFPILMCGLFPAAACDRMGDMESGKPALYIETTILSYATARDSHDLLKLHRKTITRAFWQDERHRFRLCTSEAGFTECRRGDPDAARHYPPRAHYRLRMGGPAQGLGGCAPEFRADATPGMEPSGSGRRAGLTTDGTGRTGRNRD